MLLAGVRVYGLYKIHQPLVTRDCVSCHTVTVSVCYTVTVSVYMTQCVTGSSHTAPHSKQIRKVSAKWLLFKESHGSRN
jgi:hypothetical protein